MSSLVDPAVIRTRAEFGAGLTALREAAGFTVRDLAREIGRPAGTLGDYLRGRHVPSPAQQSLIVDLLAACGVDDPAEVEAWLAALRRARASSDRRTSRSTAPYRGLTSFEPEDAALFFGRQDLTDGIVEQVARLRVDPGASRGLLAVIGPSGSGKSSLLRAGVVAAVRGGALGDAGEQWTCALATPGEDPAGALAAALAVRRAGPHLIVFDQFEEIFTLTPDQATRESFLAALVDAGPDVVVALGMRADFFAEAAREPVLLAALRHAQVVVGPLSTDQLRDVVIGPADRVGVTIEDGLVETVLADLGPLHTGGLPLLSHALLAAWDRSSGRRLTIADYRATGGLAAAVQRTAEEVFTALDPHRQRTAHDLFVRLVNVGDDVAPTRRRISRSELGLTDPDTGRGEVGEVVDRFTERRLLTLTEDSVEVSHEALLTAWPRLGGWLASDRAGFAVHRRLTTVANAWDAGGRDPNALPTASALESAVEWAADPLNRQRLNSVELACLDAAVSRRDELAHAERRRARHLVQLLVAVAVLAIVASGLAVVARVAQDDANRDRRLAAAARDDALSRQVAIQARDLAATDPGLAQQLAVAGYRISPTVESRSELIDAAAAPVITRVLGVSGPTPLAVSSAGLVAVGHADGGSVHLLSLRGGRPDALGVVPGTKKQLYALTFSPDGRLLATGGTTRDVELWDVRDPQHPHLLSRLPTGFPDALQSLAFSPDGGRLLAGGDGPHPVRMWQVGDGVHVTGLSAPAGVPAATTVQSVAFDASGASIGVATAAGEVLDWTGGRAPRVGFLSRDGTVGLNAIAFAPRSGQLVTGARDGRLTVWDTTGSRLTAARELPGNSDGQVNVVAFSPDGRQFLSGSSDDSVRRWDTASWTVVATTAEPGPVTGVAFAADASAVYSTAADGAVRRWAVAAPEARIGSGTAFSLTYTGNGKVLLVGSNGSAGGAQLWDAGDSRALRPVGPLLTAPAADPVDGTSAISGNGRVAVTGTGGGKVIVWDTRDPNRPRRLTAPFVASARLIEGVALNPDGTVLGVGGDDDNVSVWSLRDPAHPVRLAVLHTKDLVLDIAFSHDGRLLAAGDADRTARLWDVSTPGAPREDAVLRGSGNYVYGVAFSPNGRLLATSGADRLTRLWSIDDPRHPVLLGAPLRGPTEYENIPSFDADGRLLAVPSNDHTVWVYDIGTPAHPQVVATLRRMDGNVFASAFSPSGHYLVAGGRDPSVPVWSIDPPADATLICAGAGTPITRAEWRQYVPGAPYDPPCR